MPSNANTEKQMSSIPAKFVLAALLALAFAQFCTAQNHTRIRLKAPETDGREALEEYFVSYSERIHSEVTDLARDVRTVCELNEQQMDKLVETVNAAADLLIAAEYETNVNSLGTYQTRIGFVLDENGDVNPDKFEKLPRNMTYFTLRTRSETSITNSDEVAEVVSDFLTDQQRLKWDEAMTERENFLRTSAVDMFVGRVDIALIMDEEQNAQLREAILGSELADALAEDLKFSELNRQVRRQRLGARHETKYTDLVRTIFDEEQLIEWKRLFEPELAGLKQPRKSPTRTR